VDGSLHKAAM